MKKTILLLLLLMVFAFGADQRYGDVIGSHFYHARNWTVGVPFPADSNCPSLHTILGLIDSLGGGVDSTILRTQYGILTTWHGDTVWVRLDTTTVYSWLHSFHNWTDSTARAKDSVAKSGTAYSLVGGTIDQQARDTGLYAKNLALRDSSQNLRDSVRLDGKLATNGKAADASGADSADVGVVSRSCTGNAATADYATLADSMVYHKQTLTISSGRTTWALASGGYGRLLMSSNDTLNNPTGVSNGKTYTLRLIQDGMGSRLMSWPANIRFPGSVAPTLTATRMKADEFRFVGDMDSMLICVGAGFSYATSDTL